MDQIYSLSLNRLPIGYHYWFNDGFKIFVDKLVIIDWINESSKNYKIGYTYGQSTKLLIIML